jgi:hypothetical protein
MRYNSTSWEIFSVIICFLHAENKSGTEIHRELCADNGQNVMSEGTVRQWCRMFKEGRTNVHVVERSDGPSVVSYDLVPTERRLFTISELSCRFKKISLTILYDIITARQGYHKILRKMCSENVHWCAQNAENGFGFDIYRAIPQR